MEEYFDIVDEHDRVIGTAPRSRCHGDPSLVHRTAHVVVLHPDGQRILLQKRSFTKDIQPGKWDTAVGGHLAHGESYEDGARREMSEELGLPRDLPLEFLFRTEIRNEIESENVGVFLLVSEGPFRFQQEEIDEVRFFTREELATHVDDFTPNLRRELAELRTRDIF
ncbi:MAG: NUDIX domain-containing protein [Victivallales bacterium]|nr:NUDIX domain-containing protein [Victivallales bacterium]